MQCTNKQPPFVTTSSTRKETRDDSIAASTCVSHAMKGKQVPITYSQAKKIKGTATVEALQELLYFRQEVITKEDIERRFKIIAETFLHKFSHEDRSPMEVKNKKSAVNGKSPVVVTITCPC
jgi:hypothetical protein